MRAVGVAVFVGVLGIGSSALAGTVTVEQHSGRNVRIFVPTTPASPTPLVVMLHGCTQSADDFADATQMDALAEKEGFVVAYPEQPATIIPTKCFRWYDPAHQARGAGEPKDLADTADAVAAGHGVDPERVYVAGISAGAAMAVILGATYPDRFTAIGVVAGIEYKGATSLSEGLSVPGTGGPDPEAQGDLAVAAMGTYARVVPTFVVHGTADSVVAKVNGDQVHAQWLRTNTVVLGPGAVAPTVTAPGSAGYTFQHLVDGSVATGASVLEYYVVDGLGHAWPGGKAGGSYSDPKGPDASALVWAFFKGRTRTAPLAVAPPATTPGSPTTPGEDGGAPTSDPATDGGDGDGTSPPSSSATREGERDGGGCAVSHETPSAPWLGVGALVTLASILGARRSRRSLIPRSCPATAVEPCRRLRRGLGRSHRRRRSRRPRRDERGIGDGVLVVGIANDVPADDERVRIGDLLRRHAHAQRLAERPARPFELAGERMRDSGTEGCVLRRVRRRLS